ncbi:cation diffusion facilitator family transporter [Streptomyces sparsogenes]|uniref:cation diffusion facilitator family transporter n=1 Tax=Streptomyces sparsogenes TaxID=67365 RepID=UPI00340E7261
MGGHEHGHGEGHGGHSHGVAENADRRWLLAALSLISGFIVIEGVIGVVAGSLALLSDAAHMLTDAASIVLALFAIRLAARPSRGGYTYGLKRAEILSAQANGLSLLLLAVWLGYESVERLIDPPAVNGALVLATGLAGVAVNIAAAWCMSQANRGSLNVEGAFQHILNDLYAFIGTAVSGVVVMTTGFTRADTIASLVVVALMVKAGVGLVRASGRVLLEAAPAGVEPDEIGDRLVSHAAVAEVHDLHVWQITSGEVSLSAHVLVASADGDCHAVREDLERMLGEHYGITHTTLQVDHLGDREAPRGSCGPAAEGAAPGEHCLAAHGPVHRSAAHDH